MLIARSQMADTQKSKVRRSSTATPLLRSSTEWKKIERKEAEAAAFTEIAGGADDDLNDAFEKIESDAKVDAELARLMAK